MSAVPLPPGSAEAVSQVISYLVTERQWLRSHGADKIELEANRQAIIAMQWRLNRVVGAAHVRADEQVAQIVH